MYIATRVPYYLLLCRLRGKRVAKIVQYKVENIFRYFPKIFRDELFRSVENSFRTSAAGIVVHFIVYRFYGTAFLF